MMGNNGIIPVKEYDKPYFDHSATPVRQLPVPLGAAFTIDYWDQDIVKECIYTSGWRHPIQDPNTAYVHYYMHLWAYIIGVGWQPINLYGGSIIERQMLLAPPDDLFAEQVKKSALAYKVLIDLFLESVCKFGGVPPKWVDTHTRYLISAQSRGYEFLPILELRVSRSGGAHEYLWSETIAKLTWSHWIFGRMSWE